MILIIHSFDAHGKLINAWMNDFRFYLKLFVVVFAIVYVFYVKMYASSNSIAKTSLIHGKLAQFARCKALDSS